jgi:uncharacterized protein (TIGR02594 family)
MKKLILILAVMLGSVWMLPNLAEARPNKSYHYNQNNDNLIGQASRYMGSNARQLGLPNKLWCADFMNKLVGGTDRRAISYAHRGRPAYHGCTNCIAVTKRNRGHHVGIVKGYDARGNPIIISGNHSRRVGVGIYARNKVIAYRYV